MFPQNLLTCSNIQNKESQDWTEIGKRFIDMNIWFEGFPTVLIAFLF